MKRYVSDKFITTAGNNVGIFNAVLGESYVAGDSLFISNVLYRVKNNFTYTGTPSDFNNLEVIKANKAVLRKYVSGNYTVTEDDDYIIATDNAIITLPNATTFPQNKEITIISEFTGTSPHTKLTQIITTGGQKINGALTVRLPRYKYAVLRSDGSNWINTAPTVCTMNIQVHPRESFKTIQEAVEFLDNWMIGPTTIHVFSGDYQVNSPIYINLPYTLTISGEYFDTVRFVAGTGLATKPMFILDSECHFTNVTLDATTLSGYGNNVGENGVDIMGSGLYCEFEGVHFIGFNKAINLISESEIRLFNSIVELSRDSGVYINGGTAKVAETDFVKNQIGVNLYKGEGQTFVINDCVFICLPGQTCISYNPTLYVNYDNVAIQGNVWNKVGTFLQGFDFTLQRDANIEVKGNTGVEDNTPIARITVLENTATQTLPAGTWTRLNFTNTSSNATKRTVTNNRITYQSSHPRKTVIHVTGSLSTTTQPADLNIAIVKNGNPSVLYGNMSWRSTVNANPQQFATVAYIPTSVQGDYYEVRAQAVGAAETITLVDLNLLAYCL